MQSKKRLLGVICTLAVIILCAVNTTYGWQNIAQTARNITAGDPIEVDPDDPDPDDPDPDDPDPDDPDPDKPEDETEDPQKPQGSGNQNAGDHTDTGDKSNFVFYIVVMVACFIMLIVILVMRAKENQRKDNVTKEKYIGSVRFYKHVILSTVALAILVPICTSGVLLYFNLRTNGEYEKAKQEVESIEQELAEINRQLEETKAQLEAKEEVAKAAIESSVVNSWKTVLVSEEHPLPQGFYVDLEEVSGGEQVDARIVKELNAMLDAMWSEGMEPFVYSGYRDLEEQDDLFDEFIEEKVAEDWTYEEAFYKAKITLGQSGDSEHHTGLAVDIVGQSHPTLDAEQAQTKEAVWLAEHCAEYGFILRYPKDKTEVTGMEYESWHFRYVGKEAAIYIMENELTLEEFSELQ